MSVELIEIARFPAVSPLQGLFWGIFVKRDEFDWELLYSEGARL